MSSTFAHRRHWGPIQYYPNVPAYKPPHTGFTVISGPCSVEDPAQILTLAEFVKTCGATHLRGGVFRAGTYPGKNFGWIDAGLIEHFHAAAEINGLQNIIEILDYTDESLNFILPHADCVQVGTRQMQNYTLLKKLGACGKPVFLKRSIGSTTDEWLGAAEWVLSAGCRELYLIERGSSTYHNDVRWTPTFHTIPSVQSICNIPVIFDASHSTGRRDFVSPMALAGVAAGANGLLVEVHHNPEKSISDPDQAITPKDFKILMSKVWGIREMIK